MSLFDNLPHTADVLGPATVTRDSGGGTVLTFPTTRVAGVKCLILVASSREQVLYAQQGVTVTHKVAVKGASPAERGDVLQWLDPAGSTVRLRVNGLQTQPGVGGIKTVAYLLAEQIL